MSGGSFSVGTLEGDGNLALVNTASTPAAITLSLTSNTAVSTYSGVLSGSGTLALAGSGTLTLTGANTFSGSTFVMAGTLNLANSNALQNSTVVAQGSLTFDSSVTTNAFTFGGLLNAGTFVLDNNATTPAPVILTVGNNNGSASFRGLIEGSGAQR